MSKDAMAELSAELLGLSSEIKDVLEEAKEDESSIEEVYGKVLEILVADSELADQFQEVLEKHLEPYREAQEKRNQQLKGELIFQTDTGRHRLNPLYEAALAERAQFDGDIPEYRTGLLPEGIDPAVPVDTIARDPTIIGWMLKMASDQVREEVQERQLAAKQKVLGQMADSGSTALDKAGETALARLEYDSEIDPPEYRRGEKAPLMKLKGETPLGVNALALAPKERQEMVWKFLSSTQGRRSAVPIIQSEIALYLEDQGMTVHAGRFNEEDPDVRILAKHVWTIQIKGGAADSHVNFAPIDTAAAVLRTKLLEQLKEAFDDLSGVEVWLETIPVNQVGDREVGWAARVVQRE